MSTHWSRLFVDGQRDEAWGYFYDTYRRAVVAYFQARGMTGSDVEDLTQEFFAAALEREFLERADPSKGRFRSYLRAATDRFLVSHWRKEGRSKRKPDQGLVALDGQPVRDDGLKPEEVFDLAWARSVFRHSLHRAQEELAKANKTNHVAVFVARLQDEPWDAIAAHYATTVPTVRGWAKAAKTLLARYVREEIGATVTPEDLDEELGYLSDILARGGPWLEAPA